MNLAAGPLNASLLLGPTVDPQPVGSAIADALAGMADRIAHDLELLKASSGDVAPLLTSIPGRAVMDAARTAQVMPGEAMLTAAVLDFILTSAAEICGSGLSAGVRLGETSVWIGPVPAAAVLFQAAAGSGRAPLAMDMVQGTGGTGRRAVALDGRRGGSGPLCFADIVAAAANSAVRAQAAAQAIAQAVPTPAMDGARALAPEVIWDCLGAGTRIAQRLKGQHLIDSAALTAKGRGRTIGSVKPDLLVRFGVSEWR